ncbi:MAG TPA: substrate binding domain-containing protein [Kofleriaceae bacterium]|nr:substrate binding domain-containing protein [Kofleriaceae bacterium]
MKLPRGEPVATLRTTTLWSLTITSCGAHVRSGISRQNPATCLNARQMVEAAERGLDGVSNATGRLRVTAPAFLTMSGLCRDLAAFVAQHPGVELAISFTEATQDLLRDGLDVALRIGSLGDSIHKTRKLADMRRVLVAAPEVAAAKLRAPRDLTAHGFIQLSSRPPRLTLARPGRKPVTVAVHPRIWVDSAAAVRELALAGAGIATLPELLVRDDLSRGRLVAVLPEWTVASVGVYAVWPSHAQRAELTQAFIAFIAPRFASLFGR